MIPERGDYCDENPEKAGNLKAPGFSFARAVWTTTYLKCKTGSHDFNTNSSVVVVTCIPKDDSEGEWITTGYCCINIFIKINYLFIKKIYIYK